MIVQYNGQTYTITLTPQPDGTYTAAIGDSVMHLRAERQPDGAWRLYFADGQRASGYVAAQGSERYVAVAGQHFTLTLHDTQRRRSTASAGDLTAQMPGKVISVPVNAGDTVERGQTLLILEAMKMEMRVTAPAAGRVKRVLVNTGQVVERGQRLVEFEAG